MKKTTRKLTSLFLALCLIVSVIAVGIVPAAAATYETYAQDTIVGSNILHCFNWSYNNIKNALPEIARAGYTAVQTSPVQRPKDYSSSYTDVGGQWWKMYQPLGLSIAADGTSWLGTKSQLTALCTEADKYGIKVVVDIVVNHLANNGTDGGTYSYLNSAVESDLKNSSYYHTNNTRVNDDSRYNITQYHLGMPDLNTQNSYVQQRALGLLEECIDCGVDGFRFDAAKHIELPTDDSGFRGNFWPTVINGAKSYASTQGVDEPFFYGEILGGAGTDISNYTAYMAITDNYTGDLALDKTYWQYSPELADSTYYKGASAADSVLWVESHDTYMGNSGSAYFSNTNQNEVTPEVLERAWAIVGSRADSTALYFARPNTVMGQASTDGTWKSTAVAEVNKFKNHFDGTPEYLSYSGTNVAYNERGTGGVVIAKLDGGGSVSLTAHMMADGTYKDQVSGGTFTVSNGVISGNVDSIGVAVVYNASQSAIDYITQPTLYLKPNSNWTSDNARFAMYLYHSSNGSTAWVDMTSAGNGYYSASVPSGNWTNVIFCRMDPTNLTNSWDTKWNQTSNLYPDDGTNCYTVASDTWDEGGGTWSSYASPTTAPTSAPTTAPTSAPTTAPTTAATIAPTSAATAAPTSASSDTYTVYAINNAGWSNMYIHYWGDGSTTWPGAAMTSFSGTKVYSFQVPKNVSGIVFTNGSSSSTKQTADITTGITEGATWIINSTTSSGKYTHSTAPTYYLVGTMNGWSNNDNYKFSLYASDSGKLEYMLSGVQLSAGAELKVHSSSDSWYPGGNNYAVSDAGTYDIYFRPNGDGNSDWYQSYFYLANVSSYTVTWKNYDGTTLETDTDVSYGATPTYNGATPVRAATAQYSYTFSGWSPAVSAVTGNVTYTATFTSTVNKYTVTWKNYDGTTLETDTDVLYGATPTYNGATPTRRSIGGNVYTFSGWSPAISAVTGNVTYTAVFAVNATTYTILWKNDDGTVLETDTNVAQGVTPNYDGETPTKEATAQYTYSFSGWTPAVAPATSDAVYTATYSVTVNKYTVTWKNYDGTVLETDTDVPYGTTPTYNSATPTKPSDLQHNYSFSGWSPTVSAVTGHVTYTAQFNTVPISTYTITVNNAIGWDDMYIYYWLDETNNTWPGTAMTGVDNDGFTYTANVPANVEGIIFSDGNDQQTDNITEGIADGAAFVVASHNEDVIVNTVPTYYLVGSMNNWSTANAPTFTPSMNEDGLEEYQLTVALSSGSSFKVISSDNTWFPTGVNNDCSVDADGTYTIYFRPNYDGNADWHEAVFYVQNITSYTITWKDGDGRTLKTDTVTHGDTPAYVGDTPTKTATAQYTYSFNNTWSPSVVPATANATYTAQFDSTVNKYTVTWKNYDGTTLETDTNVAYGSTPTYNGATPTKQGNTQYSYMFSGWSPAVSSVTGNVTYTAQFTTNTNAYTVTWKNADGTTLETDEDVAYGANPHYDGATPTKAADAQYSYAFSGWTPALSAVTGDVVYTAQFSSAPAGSYTITVTNAIGWEDMYVYYWIGDSNNTWPGVPMTADEDDFIYTATIPATVDGIIFNNGDTAEMQQTGDITTGIADGAHWAVSNHDNAVTVTTVPTYYLVGTMTNWSSEKAPVFAPNRNADGSEEYKLTVTLNRNDECKVYGSDGSWFPIGLNGNYSIDADGTYEIYFRPNGDGNADWYQSVLRFKNITTYTITWKDGDGRTLKTDTVTHGDTPAYVGDTPTKTSDMQYTYSFNNTWSPAIVPATGNATYQARFDATVNKYTIRFVDEDGTELQSSEFEYGETPTYDGEYPSKPSTAEYTYAFMGWSPAVVSVMQDATYTAQYTADKNSYTVTWVGCDGLPLATDSVLYGETPVYDGETPVKQPDSQNSYSFVGWTPEILPVTGNVSYTAMFAPTTNTYTVTWYGENNNELATTYVPYGEMPRYYEATPTKQGNAQYSYHFIGWSPEFTPVTGNTSYTAQFEAVLNTYTVIWEDEDGTELLTETYDYGSLPSYKRPNPEKESTDQYSYAFIGWNPITTMVTEDTTYRAMYSETTNTYSVCWVNADGTTLQQDTLAYGETPVYTGATPEMHADEQYSYRFTGWDAEITTVTGDVTYTAQYTSVLNEYEIRFLNEDGTELQNTQVAYGETPHYVGATPTKGSDALYTYTFSGWTPAITAVTGAATYTALYSSAANTANTITVTNTVGWDNVYVYYWLGGSSNTWPGVPMTAAADGTYTAAIPAQLDGIVFNNGDSSNMQQTVDVTDGIADGAHWEILNEKEGSNYKVAPVQPDDGPVIITQPTDWIGSVGEMTDISVVAEGSGLTYRWYYRAAGKTSWNTTSCTSATYSITMTEARNGRELYCKITDSAGNTVDSDIVTMSITVDIVITSQPVDWSGPAGANAIFRVAAQGNDLRYQWYYRAAGKTKWNATSCTDATYSIAMTSARNGRELYCKISDSAGHTVDSDIVTMSIGASAGPVITTQPSDWVGPNGANVVIRLEAQGTGLTYQWYYRAAGKTKWYETSCTDAAYSITMTSARNGRQLYCKITDSAGNTADSDIVTMSIG